MAETATTSDDDSGGASAEKPWESSHHGWSHRSLLGAYGVDPPRSHGAVDALVVPTARHSGYLTAAVDLAARLGCPLVALCSRDASAAAAVSLARAANVELIAVEIAGLPGDVLPQFETTRLVADSGFGCETDVSLKRNLGLLLVRLLGWHRVFFLDDDVTVADHHDIRRAVALLSSHFGVGLGIENYPDNSVVCHAYREMGGAQKTFVGGGALAVGPAALKSFFPAIYNDDWFFLLGQDTLRRVTSVGAAHQRTFDPFIDPERARKEEFGDCLAEGVFWQLDKGATVSAADRAYWTQFLGERRLFIAEIVDRVERSDRNATEKARMTSALRAAFEQNLRIKPELCVQYLDAWRRDAGRWRQHSDDLWREHAGSKGGRRRRADADKVLCDLGLGECAEYVPPV